MEIACRPELWGGVECTINRVNDKYYSQLEKTGYVARNDNISHIAALQLKALRYPILWEMYQPAANQPIDFSTADKELKALAKHGIRVIAGLLHHGSGPNFTNLLDPKFPEAFSAYARRVAEKFPDLCQYTPVNEPLTTARFSGLYGIWYPHCSDDRSFIRMLFNQMKAVVMAMQEIRKINPSAQLIQTEDLCKVHSTTELTYQRDFENIRRWLSFDLLCGKVDQRHPLWRYLKDSGITDAEFKYFLNNRCPPDILGLNYYPTSERFLDHEIDRYPAGRIGGNGIHRYADTEACRTGHAVGIKKLIHEAWDRYHLPIAITEAHLGCTREEQLRWFDEVWSDACRTRAEGVDLRAVTAWSLFGSMDWDSLVTKDQGHYESGAYDVRGNVRPTAVARMIRQIALTGEYQTPLLKAPGWWKDVAVPATTGNAASTPLLILGNGPLSKALAKVCAARRITYIVPLTDETALGSRERISKLIDTYKPWAVINTLAYRGIDAGERHLLDCLYYNTTIPEEAAYACREHGIQFMTFSSVQVFDGQKSSPYDEQDDVYPMNNYGLTQAMAEAIVSSVYPSSIIIRTSSLFGANGSGLLPDSFPVGAAAAADSIVSPAFLPHVASAAIDLLVDEEADIWHLSNGQAGVAWSDFTAALGNGKPFAGPSHGHIDVPSDMAPVRRPAYCAIRSLKGCLLPSFESAVEEYHRINKY